MTKDDLVSYGVIGLCDAWSRFEPSRGIRFWTYAEPRVWGAMGDGIRQWHLVHHRNKSGIRIVPDGYLEYMYDPTPGDLAEKWYQERTFSLIWSLVDTLPFEQWKVLQLKYMHGLTTTAIHEVTGLRITQVSSIEAEAITAIRKLISDKTDESSSCSGRELAPAIFGEKG